MLPSAVLWLQWPVFKEWSFLINDSRDKILPLCVELVSHILMYPWWLRRIQRKRKEACLIQQLVVHSSHIHICKYLCTYIFTQRYTYTSSYIKCVLYGRTIFNIAEHKKCWKYVYLWSNRKKKIKKHNPHAPPTPPKVFCLSAMYTIM